MRGVHVHRIRVVDGLQWEPLLTDDERAQAGRFRFRADQDRFVAGRGAARWFLGQALRADARSLTFGAGPFGKPYVVGYHATHFNVSHSGDWILFGLGEAEEVGVDVEYARLGFDVIQLARTVFTGSEVDALSALSSDDARRAFFQLWTRKEAVMKAWGVGLSLDPRRIEVGIDPEPRRVVVGPDALHAPCEVEDLDVDGTHAAAVAVMTSA